MTPEWRRLAAAVRHNCDVSDARHAQDMTLCNYLLAMREYFRWETGLAAGEPPDRASVGAWIATREARWERLADASLVPLEIGGERLDPYDATRANAHAVPAGWVYGAARGAFGKPQFFLGRLAGDETREGVRVLDVGEEVARDIQAAPAAYRDGTIILRRDAFERWLWTSAEGWAGQRESGAMGAALEAYGFREDRAGALARMAHEQRETLLLHELGEHRAGLALGAAWESYFASLADRRAEILARAVRDLLADCLVTLPAVVDRRDVRSLHFWFATFGGMRRSLFPALAGAYERFRGRADWEAIRDASHAGREHWARAARRLAESPPGSREAAEFALA